MMSINLNEKIREQDLRNLSRIKFARIRSIRTLKVFLLMPLPIGAVFYTIWQALYTGLSGTKAHTDFILMDLMMELGNITYIMAEYLLLAVFYMGIPLLVLAFWLSYRTARTGNINYPEAGFMSALIITACYSVLNTIYHWSFFSAYEFAITRWKTLVPVLAVSVLTALLCTYILRALNEYDLKQK